MSIEISLKVDRTQWMFQEDALFTLKLVNAGASPVQVVPPELGAGWPIFRIRNLATGEVETIRKKPPTASLTAEPAPLEPRGEMEWKFWANKVLTFPGPGEYEITAEHEWGAGAGIARSSPVSVKIEGADVAWVTGLPSNRAVSDEIHFHWGRRTDKGIRLMRSMAMNTGKPKITSIVDAGEFPKGVVPTPADPLNNEPINDSWLVWVTDRTLYFRFVPYENPKNLDYQTELPDALIRLIPTPLVRPSGDAEALLWLAGKQVNAAKLQLAYCSPAGKLMPGPELGLPISLEPRWYSTAFLSDGTRRAYLAWRDKGKVQVQSVSWTESGKFEAPKELVHTEGSFVACGVSLQNDDRVSGIVISRPDTHDDMVVATQWEHHPDGSFETGKAEQISFAEAALVDDSLVRINSSGLAHAALHASGKSWYLYRTGQGITPVVSLGDFQGPILLYLNDIQETMFVFARPGMGLCFGDANGNPMGTTMRG